MPNGLQGFSDGLEKRAQAFAQQKTPVATLAAEIMTAAEELTLGANKPGAGKTAPAHGDIRMVFAKSSWHNRCAVFVLKNRLMSF
ncbi:MAG: hypothetical protein ONB46_26345 [candidate division KSB1 bacterium]|nr:hypothetical protein [candidate division KSB1 bacterium]MDZ7369460.1 hypothetical protein [candidate division KSB1 bacterium]MDZ7407573.1 hypothetical protein [candidate division KSB1 bacterium]